MKNIKRSVSIFLAVLMIFSSFSMLATTASAAADFNWSSNTVFYRMQRNDDGFIIDASGNVIADENDVLNAGAVPVWIPAEGRVAKGEKVKARVFLTTDFNLCASSFFFFYPTNFLKLNLDKNNGGHVETSRGYEIAFNNEAGSLISKQGYGSEFVTGTEVGTSNKCATMVRYGYLKESDLDTNGWIFCNMDEGASPPIVLDGSEWLMEFNFIVETDAVDSNGDPAWGDAGQLYLHPNLIADEEEWRKATILSADPNAEDFGCEDYVSDYVPVGTFAHTLNDADDESSVKFTTTTITFDANGGQFTDDGSSIKTVTGDIAPTVSLGSNVPANPSIDGGDFLGWVKADVEKPTEDDIVDLASIKYAHSETTYKAFYRLENSVKIVINYTDAKTGEAKTVDKIVASKTGYTVKLVETVPAIEDQEPNTTYVAFDALTAVEHYKFDEANSTEREIKVAEDGSSVMNVYYMPDDYTATFNPDNGDAEITETKAYWSEITAPAAPLKSGMKFTGWKLEGGDEVIAAGAKFNLAGNVSYKAQYESAETTVAVKVKYNDLADGGAEKIVDAGTVNTIAGYTVALVEAEGADEKTSYFLISDLPEIAHYEYDAANTTTTVTAADDGSTVLTVAYKPVKYTATFKGAETFADVDYFTEIIAPAGPASAGQTFTGWKLVDTDTVIAAGDKFNIDANVTYEPVYNDIYYNTTLSFNGVEDEDYPAEAVVPTIDSGKMGDEIVLADPAPVTGWEFLGWDAPVGAVEKDGKYYYGTTDVTVTGNWEHTVYTITYWLDKAQTFEYATQEYFYGDPVVLPEEPFPEDMPAGKEFVEWDTDLVSMPAENVDVFASTNDIEYTVTLTFPAETGLDSVHLDEEMVFHYGDKITEDVLADYEEIEGFTFNFWKVAGKEISVPYTVTRNVVLVADVTVNKHSVYFWEDADDYDAFMAGDETVKPYSLQTDVAYEEPIVVPVDPTREGYKFKGWDTEPSLMEDDDMHFYGIWEVESYTVFWDVDGSVVEHKYAYGEKLAIPEVNKPGYSFKGWSGLAEGVTTMPDIGNTGDEITYTAVLEANSYDAVFYVDGEVYATVPTLFNEDIVAPAAPSKDGYDFGGWTPAVGKMDSVDGKEFVAIWNAKGDTPYTVSIYTMDTEGNYGAAEVLNFTAATDAPVSYTPDAKTGFTVAEDSVLEGTVAANGSTNLVVNYSRNQYTFKTVVDGTETSSTTYYYDAAVAAPATPVKEGHTFSGWDAAVPAKMPANNVTLSGTFSKAQFDLIYIVDGKQHSAAKVTFGETVTVIAPLTKEGYTFSGWDKTGTFNMPAETVTISGTFAINSYKVIYKVDGNVVHEATAEYNSKVDLYDYTPEVGYTFSGWDKEDGFTMPASEVIVNGTTSLITVTITYEFRGDVPADYPEPAPVTATYGESINKYNIYDGDDLVTGYVSTLIGARGSVYDEATHQEYVGTDDITIIYQWNRVSVRITTTYTGDVPEGYESTEDWSKSYNDTFTLTTPAEEGYTFNGWTVEGAAEYDAATGTVKVGTAAITITGAWEINKHDVIYMVDGVEYARVEDVAYGTPVTVLDDLVEAGKTFSGWDKTDFTMPDEDVIINGSWTINNFTVTYYTDKAMTEVKFTYTGALGAEYNVPAIEKEGHEFLGWLNADGSEANLPAAGEKVTVPLNGAVYYADWKVNEYELVYNAGAGKFADGKNTATFSTAYGTAQADWEVPADPTRPGYTFGGWNISEDATMPANKNVITAIWNAIDYTVTWIDGDAEVVDNYIYGEEILAPEVEKEGYTFMGWLEADGETYFAEGDVMGEKSLVYTAQWEGNEGIEYTVYRYFENVEKTGWMEGAEAEALTGKAAATVLTGKAGEIASVETADEKVNGFYIDGENSTFSAEIAGDGSTVLVIYYYRETVSVTVKDPSGETYIDDEFTYGEEITINNPEKEGFTFVEWQDDEGNKVTFPITAPADDVVIKPIWKANTYSITFVDDNGEVIEAAKEVEFGSTIVAPADPEKDGYKFAYWRDKETKAVMPATMPAKDVTYEAFYTAGEHTTYFIEVYMMDTNGDYTMASQTVATGTTGDPISITPGNVEGCTYDASLSVLTGIITADGKATLKVYYARGFYDVTFKSGEGVFADDATVVGPTKVYFGAAIPVPAEPTREGYDFAGWDAEVPATMPAEDLTFTATWTAAEYTITYIINDKKEVKTYKFGDAVETPADPSIAGMTFTGWDTEIPATMPAKDLIIIAVFEISVYEVKYMVDGVVFQQYAVAHGDEIPVPTENPTKTFYNFISWTEIPATMPAQDIEINAIFERVPVKLVPMEGSTTVIDDETTAIYGLDLYMTEDILRESYLKVEGDGYFTVAPSQKTACGTGTVIELYDNATGELRETYTIVIFGDVNGDSKINNNDYSLAKAEADWVTSWSIPGDETYDFYKTMAADFAPDGEISTKEAASINRYILGAVDIDQTNGNIIQVF